MKPEWNPAGLPAVLLSNNREGNVNGDRKRPERTDGNRPDAVWDDRAGHTGNVSGCIRQCVLQEGIADPAETSGRMHGVVQSKNSGKMDIALPEGRHGHPGPEDPLR